MAFPIENLLSPNLTNMLITFVIPFLIIFAVLLFALRKTRILGNNNFIYLLISLGITIMIYALNPGVFQFLTSYLYQIGVAGTILALTGIIIFIFFGIIRWGHKTGGKLGKTDEERLKDLAKEEAKLAQKFYSERNLGKRAMIANRIDDIRKEERMLMMKLKRI